MREEKRQERRERIIEAATRLFNHFGFRKTSLDDVAREAGVGKATLYHYVAGKEELFGEMITRIHAHYQAELEEALAEEVSASEKLRRYAAVLLAHHQRMIESSPLSLEERIQQAPDIHKHMIRFHRTEHKVMSAVLHEGVERGVFRPVPVDRTATLMLAAFRGMVAELCRRPQESSGAIAPDFLDVLFHGLLATDSSEEKGDA
jgi:AcrR family transcriptional regulator